MYIWAIKKQLNSMQNAFGKICDVIGAKYDKLEYPTLDSQIVEWSVSKPLMGITILDATPVFRNTMTKYLALLAAGANLTVGISDVIPYDPKIVAFLRSIGVDVVKSEDGDYTFDVILDCAASFARHKANIGYVELTRSGVEEYNSFEKPVFIADGGIVKRIETILGTGESLFRAMRTLGYDSWMEKKIVVIGSGKVGSGIIIYGYSLGAEIYVITDPESVSKDIADKCEMIIDHKDNAAFAEVVKDAFMVVTATGHKDAIASGMVQHALINSPALLVNMGVEDEFGEAIPASRVLNEKGPLNFILDEPTHLKYIETTMALHNNGAVYIIGNPSLKGIINPPRYMEDELIKVAKRGLISTELNLIYNG